MCVHREHRTGNCRECHPFAKGGPVEGKPADDRLMMLRECEYVIPATDMPLLWDGDNA